jgi:hypothetical protein
MMHPIHLFAQVLDPTKINLPKPTADQAHLTKVLNITLAIMGALAFLMLVIAGFRYTISQGDPTRIADTKRMMIYTVVGLLVIALAATVVNFVLGKT